MPDELDEDERMDDGDMPLAIPVDGYALRESFGDRKPPDISRKITACVACRKQKIKCHMRDGQIPCLRCKKRNLSCTVNRSLQMLLEEDATWKNSITRKVHDLETALADLRDEKRRGRESNQTSPHRASATPVSLPSGNPPASDGEVAPGSFNLPAPGHSAGHQAWEVVMDPESGPATIPASCVGPVAAVPSVARPPGATRVGLDLVDQGVVSYAQAQTLLDLYRERLDHFLFNMLGPEDSLDQIRFSSSLLLAAICTVGSLHSRELGGLYEKCYKGYLDRCAAQTFLKENKPDDIKGFCIGAFWLSEVSWSLSASALRLSTQLQLHRSISKALLGDLQSYHDTRLYYLVYICDHHFSIAYGRPPMARECDSIQAASDFLKTPHIRDDDVRLVSQVNNWRISSSIFETFGSDVDRPILPELLPKIRRFNISLETWRADWTEDLEQFPHVHGHSKTIVELQFYFSKLYLCSLAFRGMNKASDSLPPGMNEVANTAIEAATSILRMLIMDSELQSLLYGLPLYFDTMIAFAIVFLLKVATRFSRTVRTSDAEILALVRDMTEVLHRTVETMHRQHLLRFIAEGVDKLLQKCYEKDPQPTSLLQGDGTSAVGLSSAPTPQAGYSDVLDGDFSWLENICNFDLLSSQNGYQSSESWPFTL
ncbi:hypothetical protein K402DRAFT_425996 [Aulographum hederae CBS 113979]|uniref:Zn(2)-C6 fungal-type domain-containing protein n=1 Tax=Aulographum hederae CBS 113979 TaxID=1176131 RepID=A0A6G1GIG7_9PEZI|nr:hypothetical protein K402DRAFT_425996 [Aulographum hederae CBS 113979]